MLPGIDGFEVCRRLRARRRLDAGADADRARRGRRPGRRPRRRRRRLSDEAVLLRGAARAAARADAPRARSSGRRCSRSATCGSTRRAHRAWRGEQRARPLGEGVRAARAVHAPARASALTRTQLLDGAWDIAFESRSNVVDVYVRYLREKIDRPFGARLDRDSARRRLPAAGGLSREPAADPDPAHARLRARDGARARRGRALRLPARGERAAATVDQTLVGAGAGRRLEHAAASTRDTGGGRDARAALHARAAVCWQS